MYTELSSQKGSIIVYFSLFFLRLNTNWVFTE